MLELRGLCKHDGNTVAVDDMSLEEVRDATPAPIIVASTTAGGLLEGALR